MKELEPQTEPVPRNCHYCGPENPATWVIVTDKGKEFVCNNHYVALSNIHAIQKERLLFEAEWTINSYYEEYRSEHEFDDMDQWEDGSSYGF